MSKMERAKQFMPFSALRGFEDEIRRKEFLISERRELSEDEIAALNENIKEINKGDIVEAEYYDKDKYVRSVGAVTELDFTLRFIRIIKTAVSFDDLSFIRKVK